MFLTISKIDINKKTSFLPSIKNVYFICVWLNKYFVLNHKLHFSCSKLFCLFLKMPKYLCNTGAIVCSCTGVLVYRVCLLLFCLVVCCGWKVKQTKFTLLDNKSPLIVGVWPIQSHTIEQSLQTHTFSISTIQKKIPAQSKKILQYSKEIQQKVIETSQNWTMLQLYIMVNSSNVGQRKLTQANRWHHPWLNLNEVNDTW